MIIKTICILLYMRFFKLSFHLSLTIHVIFSEDVYVDNFTVSRSFSVLNLARFTNI